MVRARPSHGSENCSGLRPGGGPTAGTARRLCTGRRHRRLPAEAQRISTSVLESPGDAAPDRKTVTAHAAIIATNVASERNILINFADPPPEVRNGSKPSPLGAR